MNILKQYTAQTNDTTKVLLQPLILLIPRKLIGGLIPKFQNSGKLKEKNYNSYTLRSTPGQDFISSVAKKGTYTIGHSYTKNNMNYGLNTIYAAKRDLKMGNNIIKKGLNFRVRRVNNGYVLDIFDNVSTHKTRENKGTERYKGDSPETAIRLPEVIVMSLVKDKPKTNKPTSENINIPNVSTSNITNAHLAARNNAIQRGWRDYFYNGKRYSLKGSDLKLARKNWNINRGRLSRKTQNSFNPSQVPQESTLNGNELKQKIAPIKVDSGYGVTASDFKTRYPLIISDEVIKNLRLEPII